MKKFLFCLTPLLVLFFFWVILWGDFAQWRYSRDMHCEKLQNPRKQQICKSIEKYQEYTIAGHGFPKAGYRATYTTTGKAWCELHLTGTDLEILNQLQYDLSTAPQLSSGAGMLYSMLNFKINPDSDLSKVYRDSVYDPQSSDYLIKGGCSN